MNTRMGNERDRNYLGLAHIQLGTKYSEISFSLLCIFFLVHLIKNLNLNIHERHHFTLYVLLYRYIDMYTYHILLTYKSTFLINIKITIIYTGLNLNYIIKHKVFLDYNIDCLYRRDFKYITIFSIHLSYCKLSKDHFFAFAHFVVLP